jgi:hypothetical protein
MRSDEDKLSLLGSLAAVGSGLFWLVPAANTVLALAGIIGILLIIARLGYGRGLKVAILGIVSVFFISSLKFEYQAGGLFTMAYFFAVIAPAFAMGKASRDLSESSTVINYGLVPYGIMFLVFIYIYFSSFSYLDAIVGFYIDMMKMGIDQNPLLLKFINLAFPPADGSIERFLAESKDMLILTLKILPGMVAIFLIGVLVLCLSVAGIIAERMGIMLPRFRPFYLWKANSWWLLPTILGLIPVVLMRYDFWFYVGINILIVTGHIYMVVGLAVIEAKFKMFATPLFIRILFYIFLVLGSLVSMVFLAVIGLADANLNFKREILENENKDN